MQPGTDRQMEGQTDGRAKGKTYWQTEGRTDTTKLIIVFRTFVKASKRNMPICKHRKLVKTSENSKPFRKFWESNSFSSKILFIIFLFIYYLFIYLLFIYLSIYLASYLVSYKSWKFSLNFTHTEVWSSWCRTMKYIK